MKDMDALSLTTTINLHNFSPSTSHRSTFIVITNSSTKHIWRKTPKPTTLTPSTSASSILRPYSRKPEVGHLDHSVDMEELISSINQTTDEHQLFALMSSYKTRQLSIRFMVTIIFREPDWQRSLALLDWINEHALYTPSVYAYNVVLRNVLRAKQWEIAYGLFDEMRQRGLSPDRYTYSTLITQFGKEGKFDDALSWLQKMEHDHVSGDLVLYSNLIELSRKLCDYSKAISIFSRLKQSGISPDLVAYNSMINVFGKAKLFREARLLLQEMRSVGVNPDTHGAFVIDEKLYIVGGSRNGRQLSDVQALDLRNLSWSTIKLRTQSEGDNIKNGGLLEGLSATSGHSMLKWGNKLFFLGGHSKDTSNNVTVRFIDLESQVIGLVETTGNTPVARGGQSVTLVGSKLIMFGGEDKHRRLLNDVYVLDLETKIWNVVETKQTPPAPRFDHTAAVHVDRYLQIFGGCSHSTFYNDLHVLDLETLEWSQPQIQGSLVSPRAGHAGVSIDEKWFIVGGGDNRSGALETLVLDLSTLVLSVLTSVERKDPLASEGLTISSALVEGEQFLVAFGGYNGNYNNEVFVMKSKPKDSKHPKIFKSPAAAAAAASVTAAYALAKSENLDLTAMKNSKIKVDLSVEIGVIKEEKKALESSIAWVKAEKSTLKSKLDEINETHADLLKELQSVQGQLAAEKSRCANLEAQISELQTTLSSVESIEQKVQKLRSQKSALEHNNTSVRRQSSSGSWRWMAP